MLSLSLEADKSCGTVPRMLKEQICAARRAGEENFSHKSRISIIPDRRWGGGWGGLLKICWNKTLVQGICWNKVVCPNPFLTPPDFFAEIRRPPHVSETGGDTFLD